MIFHLVSGDSAEHRPGRHQAPVSSPAQQLAGSLGAVRLTIPEPCHAIYSKTETLHVPWTSISQHHKSTSIDSSNLFVYTGKREVDSQRSVPCTDRCFVG